MSTTTTDADPVPAEAHVHRSRLVLAAVVLPLAPALLAVLRYVLPYYESTDSGDIVRDVAAAPGTQELVIWLGFAAALTLPLAALWAGRPFLAAAPRLTAAAEVLLVPAYLCLAWLVAGDAILLFGVEEGVDRGVVGDMYTSLHPAANVALGIFVAGHVLGTVLLGVAAIRTRAVPLWAGVLLLVCQPVHLVAAVVLLSPTLDLVAWGMNAVAFAVIGLRQLRLG